MRHHVHAIVLPHEETTISDVMKRVKWAALQRLRASGASPSSRVDSTIIVLRTRGEFDEALHYMHMNPVRKGLVEDPRAWKWSSAR